MEAGARPDPQLRCSPSVYGILPCPTLRGSIQPGRRPGWVVEENNALKPGLRRCQRASGTDGLPLRTPYLQFPLNTELQAAGNSKQHTRNGTVLTYPSKPLYCQMRSEERRVGKECR